VTGRALLGLGTHVAGFLTDRKEFEFAPNGNLSGPLDPEQCPRFVAVGRIDRFGEKGVRMSVRGVLCQCSSEVLVKLFENPIGGGAEGGGHWGGARIIDCKAHDVRSVAPVDPEGMPQACGPGRGCGTGPCLRARAGCRISRRDGPSSTVQRMSYTLLPT
jgi:hypothetical protein